MNTHISITSDNFVTGYEQQLDEQTAGIAKLHLEQFIKDFQESFGHHPTPGELSAAIKFAGLFMQEVNETYPGSFVPGSIRWDLLMCQDPVGISQCLARWAQPMDPPGTGDMLHF